MVTSFPQEVQPLPRCATRTRSAFLPGVQARRPEAGRQLCRSGKPPPRGRRPPRLLLASAFLLQKPRDHCFASVPAKPLQMSLPNTGFLHPRADPGSCRAPLRPREPLVPGRWLCLASGGRLCFIEITVPGTILRAESTVTGGAKEPELPPENT